MPHIKLAQAKTVVQGSNLGRGSGYPEVFRGSPQWLLEASRDNVSKQDLSTCFKTT